MYSEEDRKNILDKLVRIMKSIDDIGGVILVGSGAKGFTDKWSDIDLSIVVLEEKKTRKVWETINHEITSSFNLIKMAFNEYGENNFLSIVFLDNYLELDIGVISINNLVAKKRPWNVLYDRAGTVAKKMGNSWKEKRIFEQSLEIEESLNSIWYHIKNGAFALKRNKLWRATKEIEELRNEIVMVRALQENKVAKHFRDVDDMDGKFLEKLEKTFFKEVTIIELSGALNNCVKLYFDLTKELSINYDETVNYERKMRNLLFELGL